MNLANLWRKYVSSERLDQSTDSLIAMNAFIEAFQRAPDDAFAFQLALEFEAKRVLAPLRLPVFERVLFPTLVSATRRGEADAARTLAALSQFIYECPDLWNSLPEDHQSEYGLLRLAVGQFPDDARARAELIRAMAHNFAYAVHELPHVLGGSDSATLKETEALIEDLQIFGEQLKLAGTPDAHRELRETCSVHFARWRSELIQRGELPSP